MVSGSVFASCPNQRARNKAHVRRCDAADARDVYLIPVHTATPTARSGTAHESLEVCVCLISGANLRTFDGTHCCRRTLD